MAAKNKLKGLWIPLDILQTYELSASEKLVLAVIIGLSKEGQCIASNQYIADVVGLSVDWVKKIIPKLERKEYIRAKKYRDEKKMIRRVIYT